MSSLRQGLERSRGRALSALLLVLLVTGGVGCESLAYLDENSDGGGAEGAADFVGIAREACGPADGPAVSIQLWASTTPASCSLPTGVDVFRVFWHARMPVAGTTSYTPDDGQLSACLAADPTNCEPWEGEMAFDRFEMGVEATGTLEFWACDLGGCPGVSGSFDLSFCPGDPDPPLCG